MIMVIFSLLKKKRGDIIMEIILAFLELLVGGLVIAFGFECGKAIFHRIFKRKG